jgi:hypothetical protein
MNYSDLSEAAYSGNLGFSELVKFYDVATKAEMQKMEEILKKEDWEKFKKLIQDVTGTRLK